MSTQAYYKERLGFDPADTVAEHHREQRSQHGYEESLSKFKDERDAIQKKTFTKWVNKHLKKASRHVGDLFEDLRDGYNLISLLEVLSGEHLPRERGRMRFHMLQNVQMALDFLRYKKIKLVNIRAEDIVDGNPKLTLGLIWTIILHFQISDIVVGQEPNVTAREALLRWARRSTARYPGVRVTDFTGSWRDGLAFSALIHRNRPDLVDWRNARASQPRERLDRVFNVAEREYGVTRLLDPEDVDTPEPDEKSLITYISSLYDVFPEPPPIHPLYDAEAQRRSEEYRELASSLHLWIREKMCLMQERAFPPTLIEMKKLAADSTKFKNEEVPPRYRDKQRLSYLFRDLQKYFEAVGEVDIEAELHIEVIEKNWNRLMMLHQEREQAIVDEIKRLERLQRLAEKVHREMKSTDNRLEELERRVEDEARRLDRLHPLEAKHAVDLLEQDIRNTEIQIQNIFTDVHTLTEGRYSQAAELHKRVQKLHQRWVALRSLLHKRLVQPLSAVSFPVEERVVTKHRTTVHETRLVDTNPHFRSLHDCIDWCKAKIKQLQDADYGSDLPSVQNELDVHQKEHKNIEQFHPKVDRCVQAKSHFHGEESTLYSQHLAVLQKLYTELLAASNKRLSDLDTLLDFIQSATGELVWLSSKEETEVTRDWSDKNLNVQSIEQYYERTFGSGIESLMSDLEKREIQFSAVQDRGEALVLQHHPAAKTIEAYMSAMQSQWAWLLQLTLCLEVHLKHAAQSQQFFRDVQQAEQWISKRDETLNTIYSQSDFSLDEGERLLKGMQELREELNGYGDHVQKLVDQAKDVVPMKQRRQPVTRPMQVTCVCSYKQVNMSIEKGEQCTLYDNSGRIKWRVKNEEGIETPVPGVCFALQPPDKDALEAAERLRRQYDRSIALWQRKQLRLRQNMIFATIKVVKGWDLPQFLAMGQDQRTAIRKALNEDAEKLLSEGDPADPQLRRLKREMAEVNKLFDDLEKRARAEEESKNAGRIFNEQISTLQQSLDEAERALNSRITAPLPRDMDTLEHLVLQHKDFEQSLRRLAPDLDRVQQTFRGITLKTPAMRNKLDAVTTKWTQIWNSSNLYIERLKCVEIVLSRLEENTTAISEKSSNMKYRNGIIIFALCFINIIDQLNGARILGVLHIPIYSHHVPFQPLWKELIKRGHEIVLITSKPISTINSTNFKQIKYNVDLKFIQSNYIELRMNRKSFISFMKDDVYIMLLHITNKIFEHPEVKKLYAPDSKEKFDLIMIQMLSAPGLYAFAERFNAPVIGLSAFRLMAIENYMLGNIVLPSHENTWEMESNTGSNLSFWQRLNNFYVMWNFIYTMNYRCFPAHQQLAEKYFGPSVSSIKDIMKNTSLVFVNENQIISYARPELPNIIKFHSIHVADHSEPLPQDLKTFVDNATNGFIYFSMGHTMNFSIISNSIQEIFYDVFEKLPYKVVWKYDKEPLRKIKNAYITKWLPQKSVLAHPNIKLYIYQGGLQSTQEAIYHEVPVLGIPIFSDQENQVKIAVNHGIAKDLNIETLTRDKLESAIREMINNKQYKKNIINLRKLMNDLPYDSLNILIWWTEYVIRHKGAPYFRSNLAWQSWYQYCDNDIIVFLSFTVFLIAYTIIKIIRKLISYMHKLSIDQKKKTN